MKKKLGLGTAIVLVVYVLLLAALTVVESAHGVSGIRSFADALWYSLVTITTVGYGDLYPVSPVGRVIGVFFMLLSVGFLAFIISTVYSLVTGRFWPGLLMSLKRRKPWFLFSKMNAASLSLAKNLAKVCPDSLQIFCNMPADADRRESLRNCIFLSGDTAEVLHHSGTQSGPRSVFLIAEGELQNCDDAYVLQEFKLDLYCQGTETRAMPDVSFFNPCDSCARLFWQMHPLSRKENCVLLVGNGKYAYAMLNNAIVTNCRTPLYTAEYHLFGDWSPYLHAHYCLQQVLAVNCESAGKDALFFHESEWNADAELIEHADRIIFCFDDEDENVRCAQLLERCYGYNASVYVRTSHWAVPGVRFGETESLYTPELVMKRQLDHMAMQMHERYCRNTDKPMPTWDELDVFMRESNRAAADHIPTKIRLMLDMDEEIQPGDCKKAAEAFHHANGALREICRHNEHDRWMRFYSLHNWQFAPERNDVARRHPCMLPYEQLSEQERAKDDYAWQLLAECAEIQETS